MKEFPTINKRTITSAIATVYDPMGWYIPLLHRAKVFLQSLWKDPYEWDAGLPKEKADERHIQCFEGGVILESAEKIPYEICADQFCITLEAPSAVERVTFPPDIVLHEHKVQWKFTQEGK
ncbi:hypothetical protein GCK32_001909, partial [Trichostrongylus colubriformis]